MTQKSRNTTTKEDKHRMNQVEIYVTSTIFAVIFSFIGGMVLGTIVCYTSKKKTGSSCGLGISTDGNISYVGVKPPRAAGSGESADAGDPLYSEIPSYKGRPVPRQKPLPLPHTGAPDDRIYGNIPRK
jgi:hypothetical protein